MLSGDDERVHLDFLRGKKGRAYGKTEVKNCFKFFIRLKCRWRRCLGENVEQIFQRVQNFFLVEDNLMEKFG